MKVKEMSDGKCVIVVNEALPLGQIANCVAVLALSVGKKHPELIGVNLEDRDGNPHEGITTLAIPVLKGGKCLNQMRTSLRDNSSELTIVDVISATSVTRSYEEYSEKMKATPAEDLEYYGIAVYGPKKIVNQYTGSLGLLR
jgi:hypothetical protein